VKEAHMVEAVQEALGRLGVEDQVVAAGLFFPRGHTGARWAGRGRDRRGAGWDGGGRGVVAGAFGGQRASDAASGLPERMLVAVSAATVYGFDTHREREREPTDLLVRLPRSGSRSVCTRG
jgi:hypothetical protein